MADEAKPISGWGSKRRMSDQQQPETLLPLQSSETSSISAHKPEQDSTKNLEPGQSEKESALSLRNPFEALGLSDADPRRSLDIQVVDETALIGTLFPAKKDRLRKKKNIAKPISNPNPKPKPMMKRVYSREAMEALRFCNVADQRRMWKDVHVGLGPTVRKEYDFLLVSDQTVSKDLRFGFDPNRRFLSNKDRSPSLFGGSGTRGRLSEVSAN